MRTLFLNRERFLNWYFSDGIDITANVVDALLRDGQYNLDIQELLESVGFVSEHILEDGQEYELYENGDVNIENVKLKIN
jgi:hypothetical protein